MKFIFKKQNAGITKNPFRHFMKYKCKSKKKMLSTDHGESQGKYAREVTVKTNYI